MIDDTEITSGIFSFGLIESVSECGKMSELMTEREGGEVVGGFYVRISIREFVWEKKRERTD